MVRERRLVCISFSLAGDAKKKSKCPPVFELVDEHALWHVRILIQVSSSTKKCRHPFGCLHFLVRERRLELPRRLTHAPQTCLSTCSSTLAYSRCSGSIESRLHHIGLPHLRHWLLYQRKSVCQGLFFKNAEKGGGSFEL